MLNNIKLFLNEYLYAADVLATQFCLKHFKIAEPMYWVADDIGGVMSIADYFFSMNDIVEFTKYKYSTKKMFEYYDYRLDISISNSNKKDKDKEFIICIRDYKKLIK